MRLWAGSCGGGLRGRCVLFGLGGVRGRCGLLLRSGGCGLQTGLRCVNYFGLRTSALDFLFLGGGGGERRTQSVLVDARLP